MSTDHTTTNTASAHVPQAFSPEFAQVIRRIRASVVQWDTEVAIRAERGWQQLPMSADREASLAEARAVLATFDENMAEAAVLVAKLEAWADPRYQENLEFLRTYIATFKVAQEVHQTDPVDFAVEELSQLMAQLK
jgi:hypothetical protein